MTKVSRFSNALMESAWLLIFLLVPVFFNSWALRSFELPKQALFTTLVSCMVAGWLLKIFDEKIAPLFWGTASSNKRSKKKSVVYPENKDTFASVTLSPKMRWLFLGVVLIYLITSFLAVAPNNAWFGLPVRSLGSVAILSGIVFALILGIELKDKKQFDRLIKVVILSALWPSLYAFLQFFNLDPLSFNLGEYTGSGRVASTIGNPVFLGGYLIFTSLLTLGKLTSLFQKGVRAAISLKILLGLAFLLQVTGIVLSKSRGPLLGLLAGLLLFFIYWCYLNQQKKLFRGGLILAVTAGVLFVLLFAPFSPLQIKTTSADLVRLQEIFDPSKGNGSWRAGVWQIALQVMGNPNPLANAYGESDALAPFRLLIGYGPENMYLAANQFFAPGLPTAVFDRFHNYPYDLITTVGLLGFGLIFCLWLLLFYQSNRQLDLLQSKTDQIIFWSVLGGSVLAATLGAGLLLGWPFVGLGFQFGWMTAFILFPLIQVLRQYQPSLFAFSESSVFIAALLAALVGHGVEIAFSFQAVTTMVFFWGFVGLLLVLNRRCANQEKVILLDPTVFSAKAEEIKPTTPFFEVVWAGLLLALPPLAFLFNTINLTARVEADPLATWLKSFGSGGSSPFYWLIFVVWFVFGSLFLFEKGWGRRLQALLVGLILTGAVSFANAWRVANTVKYTTIEESWNWITHYEFWAILVLAFLFGALLLLALIVFKQTPSADNVSNKAVNHWLTYLAMALLLFGLFTTVRQFDLQRNQAEIVAQREKGFTELDRKVSMSARAANHVNYSADNLATLAQNYLDFALTVQDKTKQTEFLQSAENYALKAVHLNPYEPLAVSILGQVKMNTALNATDQTVFNEARNSALDYYNVAVKLSPMNGSMLYGKAFAEMMLFNDTTNSEADLTKAINLAPNLASAYSALGQYYEKKGDNQTQETAANLNYELALKNYKLAFEKDPLKINYVDQVANFLEHVRAAPDLKIAYYEQALDLADTTIKWRLMTRLAIAYQEEGNLSLARQYAKEALPLAPTELQADIQALLDSFVE